MNELKIKKKYVDQLREERLKSYNEYILSLYDSEIGMINESLKEKYEKSVQKHTEASNDLNLLYEKKYHTLLNTLSNSGFKYYNLEGQYEFYKNLGCEILALENAESFINSKTD